MKCLGLCLACALVLSPALARAQVVNGVAEWTVARGSNTSNDVGYDNDAFWQGYTLGYDSALWDPRLLTYNAEVSFRTNSVNFGSNDATVQEGRQNDLGYRLGATLFPARSFPFFIQATRSNVGESGGYPSSSGIRGGVAVPPGAPIPDFQTLNKSLALGWQVNAARLPRIELGYRTGSSVIHGGPYQAEQHDSDLHAGVFKETDGTRQALRYQKTSFENVISQVFNQRLSDLSYELGATLPKRSRATVRAGRRSSFSLFDLPPQTVDPGTGAYPLSTRGEFQTVYAIGSLTYEPSGRLSVDVTGSADRQDGMDATTTAQLASASGRYEAVRGLSLSALATGGTHGQVVGDVPTTVFTRSGQIGADYRARARWLDASAGVTRGRGLNQTPEGRIGSLRAASEQVGFSISPRGISLSAGFEHSRNEDEILDYGNFSVERTHASVQGQAGPIALAATWEHSFVERGRGETFATNLQQVFTLSASHRVGRDTQVTAQAGGFSNRTQFGFDRAQFAGASVESQLRRSLHASAWIRQELTTATETGLDQTTFAWLAQLEYRLRLFLFSIEYRQNDQDLQYGTLVAPYQFRGHQLLLRISRKFGLRF